MVSVDRSYRRLLTDSWMNGEGHVSTSRVDAFTKRESQCFLLYSDNFTTATSFYDRKVRPLRSSFLHRTSCPEHGKSKQ